MGGGSYQQSGVDIDAGNEAVRRIKRLAQGTYTSGVLSGVGSFGGLFALDRSLTDPVLVSSADGVGTKLKLAFMLDKHDTIGADLVNHCVNDIAERVVSGIASGCEQAACALIGGETAEMPGMYPPGEYDLAGFAVGVVEKRRIIDGRSIGAGDVVIGLASSGPHSNGYSLIRRIVEASSVDLANAMLDSRTTLADALMAPTRIYVKPLLALAREIDVKGMAHITGGGLTENVPRILPAGVQARIEASTWQRPAVFDWLQAHGRVDDAEMHRVFNCGIGMVVVVASRDADQAIARLTAAGEGARRIGEIVTLPAQAPRCVVA